MSNFYTLLTRVGAALHANAQVNQTTVPWTHMRLGDGNGAAVTPNENQTGLVRQVHTLQITDISVHPDNPNWVIVEAVVPSDVGGWTVREAAIYGGADGNTCIAVGNYPETYKPVLAEGAGREMVMRMVVEISSVATVKLQIDPAVAIASRAWVESLVATPAKAGLVKLANEQEHLDGLIGNKAATPAGVKAAIEAFRWPFAKLAGTQTLAENAFGIYELADGDDPSTFTLPSLSVLSKDTELLLFANHANTAAVQVKATTGQTVQGPAALMGESTTAFMLAAGGDWVRLRSEKAQGRWVVVTAHPVEVAGRVLRLENGSLMTIVYPNGTKEAPANISVSTRLVIANPFPGHHIICQAEIFVGGAWGATSWHYGTASESHGVCATEYGLNAENIVIQSGSRLLGSSVNGGDPFGRTGAYTTPSPLRVKVIKGAPV